MIGRDQDEHWKRLKLVLERIHGAGMALKKEKCKFGMDLVKILSHIILVEGISTDQDT